MNVGTYKLFCIDSLLILDKFALKLIIPIFHISKLTKHIFTRYVRTISSNIAI